MLVKENESLEIFATLFRYKWIIIVFTVAFTIASVFYAMSLPVQYKSVVNVVPPSNNSDGLLGNAISGISSKLKDFGISKIAGGSSSGQSYDLSVLMESRTVLDSMINRFDLVESYEAKDNSMEVARKILQSNIQVVNYKEGNIEFSVWDENPKKAAEMANTFVEIVNAKAVEMNQKETANNIEYLQNRIENSNKVLAEIGDTLSVYSKKYQIFSPEDQASVYSEAIANLSAAVMQAETEYEITKNKLGENDPYTKMMKDYVTETKKKLQESKSKPGLIGNFSLDDVSEVGMEYMRLYTEYEAYSKLKLFLMPSLEKAKLDMVNSNRFLYVVDEAIAAEKKDRPKRSFIVLGTFVGAFILSIIMVLIINGYRNFRDRMAAFRNKD